MAHVSNLFVALERRKPMQAVHQAIAVADRGFEGCVHGRAGSNRQLLSWTGRRWRNLISYRVSYERT